MSTDIDFIRKDKPSRRNIGGYLLGTIPATLYVGFFGYAYTKFFLHDLQLDPTLWYIGLTIYALINALNDPIIGYLTDNTDVKKWGSRRLIYIKWGSPIWALAFLLIWWIPTTHGSQFLLFLHFTITLCFYDTLMTTVIMCWLALLPDMTTNVRYRTIINFIGTIIILVFGLPLLSVSTLNHEEMKNASVIIAIVGIIAYAFMVILSKEKPEFHKDPPVPFWNAVKYTLFNRGHLCVIAINLIGTISSSMGTGFMFMYWYILGVENMLSYFGIILFIGLGSNLIAYFIGKKVDMFKLMFIYGIFQIIGGVATFFLVWNPATQHLIWVGIIWNSIFGGAGVFKGQLHLLVMDEDEVNHGQRREGMFFGVNALLQKPGDSLGPIIGTAILLSFGYIQGAEAIDQPVSVLLGIKILFLLVPQAINLLFLLLLSAYPLKGERLRNMQQKLAEMHEMKKQALSKVEQHSPQPG